MSLTLTSPAFAHQGSIPQLYTCEGEDVSPALGWSGAPAGTATFALIVHDPDAPDPERPQRDYVHWVLYDIPGTVTGLPEGVTTSDLPRGVREGINDWQRTGYGGPCPPIGRHRYFFELHALDAALGELAQPTRRAVERAMEGRVLATAVLMGTYEKAGM
ncbi:MAG TPA: YbhB/YbcL family Raf kinase inhibitor-like protein [Gemmatimonadaceae bacterium]|nr:YbhB/YbcL family Raf kinase inhibitor-like protein [Gemmatimonadaceae bacterium]